VIRAANAQIQEYRRQHCRLEKERRERMNGHLAELDRLCLEAEPKLALGKRDHDAILVNSIRLLSAFIAGSKSGDGSSNPDSGEDGMFLIEPFALVKRNKELRLIGVWS
jgi:hypothetical protein